MRYLLATSGVLFLGSMGAFFLFVPALSIATVVWILVGLVLMFVLGVQVGTQAMLPSQAKSGGRLRSAFLTIRSHLTAYGYVTGGTLLQLTAETADKEHIPQFVESVRHVPLGTLS